MFLFLNRHGSTIENSGENTIPDFFEPVPRGNAGKGRVFLMC
jgi:hypothetical protein